METLYSFDRIKISTFEEPETLKKLLPVNEMKTSSYHFQIDRVSDYNNFPGYRSRIDVVAPSEKCLTLLYDCKEIIGNHKISYIEIAQDEITPTTYDAQAIHGDFASRSRKKWGKSHYAYTNMDFMEYETKLDSKKFGRSTNYSCSKNFGIRAYCRLSKMNDLPAFHREYFIKEPATIFQKTGIKDILDLLTFDFPTFFQTTDEKYISKAELDTNKVGRWFKNVGHRKKFTKRELISIGCHGSAYTVGKNYGDFLIYMRNWQKYLKGRRGPKTQLEQRILNLKDFSRFTKR